MPSNSGTSATFARSAILYIDDETNNLLSFTAAFRRDFDILTANSPDQARKMLDNPDLKVIISDQRMPGMKGVEFFAEIKETHPEPIRILLTGYSNLQDVIAAINDGEVYRYLTKPWEAAEIRAVINQAIEVFDLRRANNRLLDDLRRSNSQLEFYLRQKLIE